MIGVIGINHKTAPVSLREKFIFRPQEISGFLAPLIQEGEIAEGTVLSTCNRTEIYFATGKSCFRSFSKQLIRQVLLFKRTSALADPDCFYQYRDEKAAEHLFKVTSGLDSMVLGENQILGQVKEAYRLCSRQKLTGPLLNRLFHRAFEAGKRVRTQTQINRGATSVSYAAVELAFQVFDRLDGQKVLLLGAGETGELVLKSLKERGSLEIIVMNRTPQKAQNLAQKYQANMLEYSRLEEGLLECDIVVASTSSDAPLIRREHLEKIRENRKNRMLLLIDVSVPRNIHEDVKATANTLLYNIDDLEEVANQNSALRRSQLNRALEITQEKAREFQAWVAGLELSPTINQLKKKLTGLTSQELKGMKSRLSRDEYETVHQYSHVVQEKFSGLIIKNLKTLFDQGKNRECINLVNRLFELKMPPKGSDPENEPENREAVKP